MNPTATETVFFRPPHDVLRRPATAIRELDRLDARQGPAPGHSIHDAAARAARAARRAAAVLRHQEAP
jgi:hypothetical protein